MKVATKRVVILGPESTGKSTLSQDLAQHYRTKWAKEYAREYLEKLDREYVQADLVEIARGQIFNEEKALQTNKKWVFFDTNLEVIKVWSDYKYGNIAAPIIHWHRAREYDMYLVTDIDLPWEEDPLREHPLPKQRQELLDTYMDIAEKSGLPFMKISGNRTERMRKAIEFIESTFEE